MNAVISAAGVWIFLLMIQLTPESGLNCALLFGFLTALLASKSWRAALILCSAAGLLTGAFLQGLSALLSAGVNLRFYFVALTPMYVKALSMPLMPLSYALFGGLGGLLGAILREGLAGARRLSLPMPEITAARSRWLSLLFIALVLLVPLQLSSYWNYNLGTIGIYVLLGLGLNIVVGKAGLLDLGYVAFFAIGAYSMALLTAPTPLGIEWSFWPALIAGIGFAALAGILLGLPVLRLRGDYLAIVTLGFGEIIRILSKADILTPYSGGPRGVRDIAGPTLFGYSFEGELQFLYLILLACFLVAWVTSRLEQSRTGRAWVAMREDELVARALGINTWKYKLMAFALGAAFAGLGGALFAARNEFTGPEDHHLLVSINVLAVVIVGGMGSIRGVILGALVLKGVPELLREVDAYRMLFFGGLLVATMIYRPEGLWPSAKRQHELHEGQTIST